MSMSSEFAAALAGALVGGGFTLVGAVLTTLFTEHRTQIKADQVRLNEIYAILQNLKSHASMLQTVTELGPESNATDSEKMRRFEANVFLEYGRLMGVIKGLTVALYKNFDLAERLMRLSEANGADDIERLAKDVQKRINPKLFKKLETSLRLP